MRYVGYLGVLYELGSWIFRVSGFIVHIGCFLVQSLGMLLDMFLGALCLPCLLFKSV